MPKPNWFKSGDILSTTLLAIIRALTELQHYLQGSQHPTTILSNHKNLMYFKTAQKMNRQQARCYLTLSEYNIKLIHVPGKQMVQSDALSWWPNLCPDEDTNNCQGTSLAVCTPFIYPIYCSYSTFISLCLHICFLLFGYDLTLSYSQYTLFISLLLEPPCFASFLLLYLVFIDC